MTSVNGSPAYTAVGDPTFMPTVEFDTAFQYMGGLTWNKNAHSVRFGLGLIRRRGTIGQSSNPQGSFTFTGAYTGVALGDLLEGLPITMTRTNVLYQPSFRTWEPSFYVQDDLACQIMAHLEYWRPIRHLHAVHGSPRSPFKLRSVHRFSSVPVPPRTSAKQSNRGCSDELWRRFTTARICSHAGA